MNCPAACFLLMSLATPVARAQWESIAPLPEPAAGFVAGALGDKIVVLGGTNWRDDVKRWLDTVWVYDPGKNSWSIGPKLPRPIAYAAGAGDGRRLIFAGGADGTQGRREIQAMDADMKLTRLGELPEPVVFAGGAILAGRLHIIGGTPDPDDWGRAHARHYTVSLDDGKVAELPKLAGYDRGFGLVALAPAGGRLMAFGGAWFDAAMQVHNLDRAAVWHDGPWRPVAPLPLAARGIGAVAIDHGRVFLLGGFGTPEQGFLKQAWVYDSATDRHAPAPPSPLGAVTHLVRCGDFVYQLGGEDRMKHRASACFRIPVAALGPRP